MRWRGSGPKLINEELNFKCKSLKYKLFLPCHIIPFIYRFWSYFSSVFSRISQNHIKFFFFLIRQNPDQRREIGWFWTVTEESNGYTHSEVPPHPQELERFHSSGYSPHHLCNHCHGLRYAKKFQQQLSGDPDLPISLRYLWTDSLLCVSFFPLTKTTFPHTSRGTLCLWMPCSAKELSSHSTWSCQRNTQFDLLQRDTSVTSKRRLKNFCVCLKIKL